MRLFRANARIRNAIFLGTLFFSGACIKDPVWLAEFRTLLENTNREIEETLPLITQTTEPEIFYVGLRRMDRSSDQMISDLRAFFEKYPYVLKDEMTIGFYLRKQIDRFGKNLKIGFAAGNAWEKKLGHEKEFRQLSQRIDKKARQFRILLGEAKDRAAQ
jgi:transposase